VGGFQLPTIAEMAMQGFNEIGQHVAGAYAGTHSAISVAISCGEICVRLTAQRPVNAGYGAAAMDQ